MAKTQKATREVMNKQNEIFEVVQYAKRELVEKQRAELPKFIKKRKKQFIKQLEEYNIIQKQKDDAEGSTGVVIANKTLPMYELTEMCFAPFINNVGGIAIQYSPDEMQIMFEYFKDCVKEMNKYELVPPNKEMFCSICGFSTEKFSELKSQSPEMREVLLRIEDYIANYLNISGLTRKTDTVTGIFIQKSSLGRREATEPQQVVNNNILALSDSEFAELLSKYPTKK